MGNRLFHTAKKAVILARIAKPVSHRASVFINDRTMQSSAKSHTSIAEHMHFPTLEDELNSIPAKK